MSRTKGSRNKLKNIAIVLASRKGKSPLEFMLSVMDDTTNELAVRMDAAFKAAPYVHQRLATLAVQVSGEVQVNKIERSIVHIDNTDSRNLPTVN